MAEELSTRRVAVLALASAAALWALWARRAPGGFDAPPSPPAWWWRRGRRRLRRPAELVVHQTWKHATLPPDFLAWSRSWRRLHAAPRWRHVLWTDASARALVAAVAPREFVRDVYDAYDREIKRVDAARYFWLREFGGVYADLDSEAMRPFDCLLEGDIHALTAALGDARLAAEVAAADVVLGRLEGDRAGSESVPNALMVARVAGAPFWDRVITELARRAGRSGTVEWQTGPALLRDCVAAHRADPDAVGTVVVLPPRIFYPVTWTNHTGVEKMKRLAYGMGGMLKHELFPDAFAITYWCHTWS